MYCSLNNSIMIHSHSIRLCLCFDVKAPLTILHESTNTITKHLKSEHNSSVDSGLWSKILLLFSMSVIMSVLQYCNTVWFISLSDNLKMKLMNLLKMCSKPVGKPLQRVYELSYHPNLVRLANNILSEANHVL